MKALKDSDILWHANATKTVSGPYYISVKSHLGQSCLSTHIIVYMTLNSNVALDCKKSDLSFYWIHRSAWRKQHQELVKLTKNTWSFILKMCMNSFQIVWLENVAIEDQFLAKRALPSFLLLSALLHRLRCNSFAIQIYVDLMWNRDGWF